MHEHGKTVHRAQNKANSNPIPRISPEKMFNEVKQKNGHIPAKRNPQSDRTTANTGPLFHVSLRAMNKSKHLARH